MPGRLKGFQLGISIDPDAELDQIVTKHSNGAGSRTFTYAHDAASGLVEELFTGTGGTQFKLARQYETDRNAVTGAIGWRLIAPERFPLAVGTAARSWAMA